MLIQQTEEEKIHLKFRGQYVLCNKPQVIYSATTRFLELVTCEECKKLIHELGFDILEDY